MHCPSHPGGTTSTRKMLLQHHGSIQMICLGGIQRAIGMPTNVNMHHVLLSDSVVAILSLKHDHWIGKTCVNWKAMENSFLGHLDIDRGLRDQMDPGQWWVMSLSFYVPSCQCLI